MSILELGCDPASSDSCLIGTEGSLSGDDPSIVVIIDNTHCCLT